MTSEREYLDGLNAWIGRECTEVLHREYDWVFSFENTGTVTCECPWRIVCNDYIALANIDDGQLFGLKVPVDGPAKAKELVAGKKVVSVQVAPISSDLTVSFERETILELFNHSSGYEGWQATAQNASGSYLVIAMGGGRLAIWKK